uniref:Uncharacterized protein n=1 Tax=mine drainage metagenome TaxID=410659 RepID=E6QW85_9ZZZZ
MLFVRFVHMGSLARQLCKPNRDTLCPRWGMVSFLFHQKEEIHHVYNTETIIGWLD